MATPRDPRAGPPLTLDDHNPQGGGHVGKPRPIGETQRWTNANASPRGMQDSRARPNRGGRYDHVYGALDLGTNNCRLLIARPDAESFRVIDAFSRVVRLGEGVDSASMLSSAAMSRAIEALKVCADKMQRRGVTRARTIATEACRRAANVPEFLERVTAETGLTIEIIDAGEEARLAVAGCAPLFEPQRDSLLVFDIGGGSTELVWIDLTEIAHDRRRDILLGANPPTATAEDFEREVRQLARNARWVSLPVGVVTLSERFKNIVDDKERFALMQHCTEALIKPFAAQGDMAGGRVERMQLLGTSGTITTLAGVYLGLPRYDRSKVDGLWMDRPSVSRLIHSVLGMQKHERSRIPCIGNDRVELVLSGSAILSAIFRFWPADQLRVADRGLREGLLYGLMNREDALARQVNRT